MVSPSRKPPQIILDYGTAQREPSFPQLCIQTGEGDGSPWPNPIKKDGQIWSPLPANFKNHITDSEQFNRLVEVSSSSRAKLPVLEDSELNRALCYVTGNMYLFRTAKGEFLCHGAQTFDSDAEDPLSYKACRLDE